MVLLKNFFRELRLSKTTTIINVTGFAIALTTSIILAVFTSYHLSFDNFNEKTDRIFRLNYLESKKDFKSAVTNHQWYNVLENDIPGVEEVARIGWPWEQDLQFEKNNIKAVGCDGDKELFDIFSFKLIEKQGDDFFEKPTSMAISETLANKIFGNTNCIGKTLNLNYGQEYTITAVFKDIPDNSSVQFSFLFNMKDGIKNMDDRSKSHWLRWWVRTFVLTTNTSVAEGFAQKMQPLQEKYIKDWHVKTFSYYLQPLSKMHLHSSEIRGSFDSDISNSSIIIFCSAGILILIISCINFINLSIAGFEERRHAVSIRKIIGASKGHLFKQYLLNSVLLTICCIIVALFVAEMVLPLLRSQGLNIPGFSDKRLLIWTVSIIAGVFIGLISGIYPAVYLSRSFKISDTGKRGETRFRNALITFQFIIAILLLTTSSVIHKQINKGIHGNLGYNPSSVISFAASDEIFEHYEALHSEMEKIPGVYASTSCAFGLPGHLGNYWGVKPSGADNKTTIFHTQVAKNFFEVMQIPVKAQLADFQSNISKTNAVINREAMEQFALGETILGRTYSLGDSKVEVKGIVDNFHNNSLHQPIKPVQYGIADKCWNQLVRIETANNHEIVAQIEQVWKKFENEQPFNYIFLDDLIASQYDKERSQLKILNLFFVLSIFISLIGLIGLVKLILKFRTKEIGIRKVNGAKVSEILSMLNKDFIKWVAIAFVIATPIAYYAMSLWLENFAYKTTLSWWIFALAGVLALGVALLTVSWQSWRAATRNPVEALRYE